MIIFPFQFGGLGFSRSYVVEDLSVDTDPYFNNVSLLIHADGANNSTAFTDVSISPKTITRYGDAKVSTTQSMFGGTSIVLDGIGDYISVPASSDFNFGANDFTIECFMYLNATPSGHGLITEEYIANDIYFALAFCDGTVGSATGSRLSFGNYQSGSWQGVVDSSNITTGTWHHVAGVRSGDTWTLFLNGVSKGSTTISRTLGQQDKIQIGRRWDNAGGEYLNAYIDEVRITKGFARYTANFTVPTRRFYTPDPSFSSVSLLLRADGINNSTTFTDVSIVPKTLTANGNAKISTDQSKFGNSSAYFDGSGDYISTPTHTGLSLSADFTIEGWIYLTAQTNHYATILGNGVGSFAGEACFLMAYGTSVPDATKIGKIGFGNPTTNPILKSTTVLSTSTWYHVAVSRTGTTCKLFVNGTEEASATNSSTFNFGSTDTRIGSNGWDGANSYFSGYIDELRVTKGTGRYTASFTAPVEQYPLSTTPLARYWRINISANNGSTNVAIGDFGLFNKVGGTNIATGGTATASTTNGGYTADLAFDGNAATLWNASTNVGWLKYDFGSGNDKTITQFTVVSRSDGYTNDAPKDFTLEYSTDNSNWNVVSTITNSTGWTAGETRTFTVIY